MATKTTLKRKQEISVGRENSPNKRIGSTNNVLGRGIAVAIMESIAAGLSFGIGFILMERLNIHFDHPSFVAESEMLLISAGMAFGYAFVFVLRRCYMADSTSSRSKMIKKNFANLTYAYMLELGLLFIIKDTNFALEKAGILLGYVTGIILLSASSIFLIPFLFSKTKREGKKKLIIKAPGTSPVRSDTGAARPSESNRLPKEFGKRKIEAAAESKSHAPEHTEMGASIR